MANTHGKCQFVVDIAHPGCRSKPAILCSSQISPFFTGEITDGLFVLSQHFQLTFAPDQLLTNIVVINWSYKDKNNRDISGSVGKESACNVGDAGDTGSIPGLGRRLEKEMVTQSGIFAWRIPRTEEPGGLLPGSSPGGSRVIQSGDGVGD